MSANLINYNNSTYVDFVFSLLLENKDFSPLALSVAFSPLPLEEALPVLFLRVLVSIAAKNQLRFTSKQITNQKYQKFLS